MHRACKHKEFETHIVDDGSWMACLDEKVIGDTGMSMVMTNCYRHTKYESTPSMHAMQWNQWKQNTSQMPSCLCQTLHKQ